MLPFFPSMCHEVMGQMTIPYFFECWILSQFFHSPLSSSSRDSPSSSIFAFRVVSSAYLKLVIFLLAILIPTCDSSSPAFHMIYSAYKLKKQDENIQPCRTPFLILNQSVVPCLVLTVASWPEYRFLRRQVRSNDFSDDKLGCQHPEEQEQILLISVFLHTWQG